MFDQFLRNKINSLFDKFIEDKPGETNIRKWDGIIEMHDLRLKRTLVDLLCPILGMPMTFIGGRVAKLTVQIPWSALLKDETKVVVEGISIVCHTSDAFWPEYFKQNRRRYIDKYIRTYLDHNNELESRKNKYLARVQDFIFGRISLEVRNVHLCMENSLERPFMAGLVCQRATIRNFYNGDQHRALLQLEGIGAYLNLQSNGFAATFPQRLEQFLARANNTQQRRYVVHPTQITYQRIHIKGRCELQNNLSFQPISVELNNVTADMLRLLVRLIEWHSCCNRTCSLRDRFSRSDKKATVWWRYLAQVMIDQYRADRDRRLWKHLLPRRRDYIQLYQMLYKGRYFINKLGPNNTFMKLQEYNEKMEQLKTMEDSLELFEIIEYRKFAEEVVRSRQEIEKSYENIRKKEYSWFSAFFASKEEDSAKSLKMLEEQAKELATLETIKLSTFTFTIERLQVKVAVRIEQHEDPFMVVRVDKIMFRRITEKNTQRKTLEIEDCVMAYEEYLGCYKGYRNLFERKEGKSDDEFEDFRKSIVQVEWRVHPEHTNTDVRIEPFRVIVNDETLDKFMLFKEAHSRSTNAPFFESNRSNAYREVKQDLGMNFPSSLQMSISMEVVVPESLYEPSTEIIVGFEGILMNVATRSQEPPTLSVNVGLDALSCRLRYTDKDTKATMLQYLFERMNLRCQAILTGNNQANSLSGKIRVQLSEIGLKFSNRELQQLLYLAKRFSRFLSPQKLKQKPSNRRKPSLGEEFLDAVDNLTDHVYKGSISHSNVKRSRTMFNLQNASNKIVTLLNLLNFDLSCPEMRMGYYIAGKVQNSLAVATLSVLANQVGNNIELESFANSLEVVFCEYIFFGDSLKKVRAFVESNKKNAEELPIVKIKEKDVSNLDVKLKARLTSATVKLFSKDNLLFVLSLELNLEGFNLKRPNRQLKSSTKFRLQTSYLNKNKQRTNQDIIQPFRVNVDLDQIEERIYGKAEIEEVVVNVTGELFSAMAQLAASVLGEMRVYRIVNLLNVPVHVKGRPNGFVEVPSGKDMLVKAATNYVLEYIVQGVKYTETGDDRTEVFLGNSNVRLIRQVRTSKEGTIVIFKSNIRFLNESANSVGLTVMRKEVIRYDDDGEDYYRGCRRASQNIIKSKQEVFLICDDLRQLNFEVKLDLDMSEDLQPLSLATFLKENTERLLASENTFLVLYPKVTIKAATELSKEISDYDLRICCPLQVSNYLPGPISLRFLKEEFVDDRPWTESSSNRYRTRSKSVEMLALQRVNPLECFSLSSTSLEDINEIYVQFGPHCKTFKLDLQYEMLEQQEAWSRRQGKKQPPSDEFELVKVVTLTNAGIDQINIVCRMTVRRHSIRLFFMSDMVVFNLLDFRLSLRIKEEGYFYNEMTASSSYGHNPDNYALSDRSYNHKDTLRMLFEESRDNLILFTGDSQCASRLFFFNDNEVGYDDAFAEPVIHIRRDGRTVVATTRKIQLDFGLVLLFIAPLCTFVNRSSLSAFVRSGDLQEKIVRPHEKQPVTTFLDESVRVGVRGIGDPSKQEEFHINTDVLGIVYFRREVAPRQYRFFRVLTSKSQSQTNILLEDSEYPPITFINRLKEKIRVTEMDLPPELEHPQDLNESESLEYALIKPYRRARFKISIYSYECTTLKDGLQFDNSAEIFECYDKRNKRKIYIATETFKSQRVVLISYSREFSEQVQKVFHSGRESLLRLTVSIRECGFAFFTASYREYGYLQYESIEFDYKQKVRHSSLYFKVQDTNMYSYSDTEPRLMLSVQHDVNLLQSLRNRVGLDKPVHNFLEVRVKYNFASNVRVIKFMEVQVLPVLLHLDVKFAIDMLQNCMPLLPTLRKIEQLVGAKLLSQKATDLAVSKPAQTFYIVEHLKMGRINLELSFANLETLRDIYEGSTVYSLIIEFLNNMGKIKPFTMNELELRYENLSFGALLRLFNMRDHFREIVGQIMLKPAKQLHAAAMALMGFTSSLSDDSSLISSSLSTSLYVVKTFLKNLVRGRQLDMSELEVNNKDVVAKLCSLKYWKVRKNLKKSYERIGRYDNGQAISYSNDFVRYERYTFGQVQPYDRDLSLAKHILAQRTGHKTVTRINSVYRLSAKNMLFLTDCTAVFVDEANCQAEFWSPEQILHIERVEHDLKIRLVTDGRPGSLKAIELRTVFIRRSTIQEAQLTRLKEELKDFRQEESFYLC